MLPLLLAGFLFILLMTVISAYGYRLCAPQPHL
jgi:hypothetical protein